MPANPLHVLGCDLISRLYAAGDSPVDFADYGYETVDTVTGEDMDGVRTCFGKLLACKTSPHRLLVVIRGTKRAIEWVSDGIAVLVGCHFAPGCRVEAGFDGIYESFQLASGCTIYDRVSKYAEVIAFGHSLGGPLATEFAAQMGASELVCYASPKPGDPAFAVFVREKVQKVTLYDHKPDIVPDAPFTFNDPLDRFNFVHVATKTTMDPAMCVPPIVLPEGIESLKFAHAITTYKQAILTSP